MFVAGDVERINCKACRCETVHTFTINDETDRLEKGWTCSGCDRFISVYFKPQKETARQSIARIWREAEPSSDPTASMPETSHPRPTLAYSRRSA